MLDISDNKTVQNLVNIISKFCVKELKIEKVDNQPLELEYLILSIEKALNEIGWIPRLDLEKTILNIVKWYKDVNKGKSPFKSIIGNIDSFL